MYNIYKALLCVKGLIPDSYHKYCDLITCLLDYVEYYNFTLRESD